MNGIKMHSEEPATRITDTLIYAKLNAHQVNYFAQCD